MNPSPPYDPFHPPGATRTFTFVSDHPFRSPKPESGRRRPQRGIVLSGTLRVGQVPSPEDGRWQPESGAPVNPAPESQATVPQENQTADRGNQGKPVAILSPVRPSSSSTATPSFGPAFVPPAARPEQLQSFG